MWHDCDSNCDSASGEPCAAGRGIEKARIYVARPILSTDAAVFFRATVAAMQHEVARRLARDSDQAASPAASFARSEEHTSELQSLMRISSAVFCLKKKHTTTIHSTLLSSYHHQCSIKQHIHPI